MVITDIHQRSHTYIPPCVMASSAMGLNLGVFGFLLTTHVDTKMQNKCVQNIRVFCDTLCVFVIMLRLQYMQVKKVPDKPRLF